MKANAFAILTALALGIIGVSFGLHLKWEHEAEVQRTAAREVRQPLLVYQEDLPPSLSLFDRTMAESNFRPAEASALSVAARMNLDRLPKFQVDAVEKVFEAQNQLMLAWQAYWTTDGQGTFLLERKPASQLVRQRFAELKTAIAVADGSLRE